jgi:capsular exopolysaccharide synthesis family protein
VSLNLAAAFYQNHLKVLIVDADLRKPRLHERLETSQAKGLTDILERGEDYQAVIQSNVKGLGFDFLSAGSFSERPTEILGTEAMTNFMEKMRAIYDVIVLDSPPYLAVADVAVLSEYMDAILVVACYQRTEKRHLKDLKRRFGHMMEKPVGVVINRVNVREKDYYYHQYYYYGYSDSAARK